MTPPTGPRSRKGRPAGGGGAAGPGARSALPAAPALLGPGLVAPALVAAAACLLVYAGGWRGTDWAAQIYRSSEVARHGLVIWDPGWYGGTFPLGYSLVYPLVAGYLGLWVVAVASAAGAAGCFDRLVTAGLGRRPAATWYFAVSTAIPVAIGQLPTLAGEALALGCVLCLAHPPAGPRPPAARAAGTGAPLRLAAGVALGVLSALTTPVAGAFLALALFAWAISPATLAGWGQGTGRQVTGRQVTGRAGAACLVLVSTAALPLMFPGAGHFPFPVGDMLVAVAIAAFLAAPRLGATRPLRAGAVLYGLASIALFVLPTPMGDNDARLAAYMGVPLIFCYLPTAVQRWRAARPGTGHAAGPANAGIVVLGVVVAVMVAWEWGPIAEAFRGTTNGPASVAAYYRPLTNEIRKFSGGRPVRVEIPPLAHHWEAAYLAPEFPLARGWERQLDMAYNDLFYRPGPLRALDYRAWLLANGVSYVALPARGPFDYSAEQEAALVRSGTVPGLRPVWRDPHWELWEVKQSPGLASGPGRVVSLRPGTVVVDFSRPGVSEVKVRWSRYWTLPAAQRSACLMPASGDWTAVRSAATGTVRLTVSVLHADHGRCVALVGANSGVPSKSSDR